MPKDILIIVGDDLYEVSRFVKNHPGEGIHDVYLSHYNRKDVTSEYEHFHFDDQPDQWLLTAREKKYDPETGIYFLGKNIFGKARLPAYLHFFYDDLKGENYLKSQNKDKIFVVTISNSDIRKELTLSFRDEKSEIHSVQITQADKDKWAAEPKEGDKITGTSLPDVVEKLTIHKGLEAV